MYSNLLFLYCVLTVSLVNGLPTNQYVHSLSQFASDKCPSYINLINASASSFLSECTSTNLQHIVHWDLFNEKSALCVMYNKVFEYFCTNPNKTILDSAFVIREYNEAPKRYEKNYTEVCKVLKHIDEKLVASSIFDFLQNDEKCRRVCTDLDDNVVSICSVTSVLLNTVMYVKEIENKYKLSEKTEALETTSNVVFYSNTNSQKDTSNNEVDVSEKVIQVNNQSQTDKTRGKYSANIEQVVKETPYVETGDAKAKETKDLNEGGYVPKVVISSGKSISPINNMVVNDVDNTLSADQKIQLVTNPDNVNSLPTKIVSTLLVKDDKVKHKKIENRMEETVEGNVHNEVMSSGKNISPTNNLKVTNDILNSDQKKQSVTKPDNVNGLQSKLKYPPVKDDKVENKKNANRMEENVDNTKKEEVKPHEDDQKQDKKNDELKNKEFHDGESGGQKPAVNQNEIKDNVPVESNDKSVQIKSQHAKVDENIDLDNVAEDPFESEDELQPEDTKAIKELPVLKGDAVEEPPVSEVRKAGVIKPQKIDEDSLDAAVNNHNQNIDDSNSYFFSYFMMVCVMFICGYVAYHNKQKILALVLEGRKGRRSSRTRRPNSANYRKLDSTLEEAMTSSCTKNSAQVIY